jgi:hypothetical protein
MTFNELAANLQIDKTQTRILNGEEYWRVPTVLLQEQILNGSQGPLFYPKDEWASDPGNWNGMPLLFWHPTKNGKNCSADDPYVTKTFNVGFFDEAEANGKLRGYCWFNKAKTRNADGRFGTDVSGRIERGSPIEVSTGLFTDNIPVEGGSWKGQAYDYVARNYRPDHVAILPDQVGACSVNDGCGIGVMNRSGDPDCPT